jgi:hypothetical protein
MIRTAYKVALVDLVLVIALYFVFQDLAWRDYYAGTPHARVSGYSPSTSYSLLVRLFTMAGGSLSLTSPPTLDWVQVIAYVLVAVNGWLVYALLKSRPPSVDSVPAPGAQD